MSATAAYAWKGGAGFARLPAQLVGEELSRIRASQGSYFSPAAVVLASRPADAPLHEAFEWDDTRAAAQHRETQARHLIRHIVIVNPAQPKAEPIRAFVSVRTQEDERRYTTTTYAMSNPNLREQVLAQALADLRAFERKYAAFLDLSGVMRAFDEARIRAEGGQGRLPD